MWQANNWKDYELLDASDGERLERWGKYILVRPDPQIIWQSERRQVLPVHQTVDYGRFTYIGAPRKGKLRQTVPHKAGLVGS